MFLLVLSAAVVLQTPPQAFPSPSCRALAPVQTATAEPGRARKLAEMPPGRLMHAVLRSVGGCEVLEVLSQGKPGPGGLTRPGGWVWEPAGPALSQHAMPAGEGR
jgi:hypothetical protein